MRRCGYMLIQSTLLTIGTGVAVIAISIQQQQPVSAVVPGDPLVWTDHGLPIPSGVSRGEVLLGELNCIACHAVDEPIRQRLLPREAPILDEIGSRIEPAYLRDFLTNPHHVKPGTTMPHMLGTMAAESREMLADVLTHYLISLGGPMAHDDVPLSEVELDRGRILYHQVGCVACHGPLEPPSVLMPQFALDDLDHPYGIDDNEYDVIPDPDRPSVPLGDVARKTSAAALADFLRDPLKTRPHGRMPSLNLSDDEARQIAGYLTHQTREGDAPARPEFRLDPMKVNQGRGVFVVMGCADCHTVTDARGRVDSLKISRSLTNLDPDAADGCLGDRIALGRADYSLSPTDRAGLRETLNRLNDLREPLAPTHRITRTLAALNCYACHERDSSGGPSPALRNYFITLDDAELGDEGRFPPTLTGVGAKLRSAWLHEILVNAAATRDHYMATRMPQFGESNVAHLVHLFEHVDCIDADCDRAEPIFDRDLAEDGRKLVGLTGMACINCHSIAGRESIGVPGTDLATAHERLRYDWFVRYLHDPSSLRPGTRMPTFWPHPAAEPGAKGVSPFPDVQAGEAQRQIDAIWTYLSLGEMMPLPQGAPAGETYEIVVTDRPRILRTFITGAGVRAIAIGFPEQIHIAFDATQVRLALAWKGPFLSAAGAWAQRGGMATTPLGTEVLTLHDGPPFRLVGGAEGIGGADVPAVPGKTAQSVRDDNDEPAAQPAYRMHGYLLDENGRPTFRYSFGPLFIEEQPLPLLTRDRWGILRRFTIRSLADDLDGMTIEFNAPLDGRTVRFDGPVQEKSRGTILITVPSRGEPVSFDVEITW